MNRMTAIPPFTGTQPYRVTADDYLRLIEAGGFGDAHVELVDGRLVEMAPGGLEHGGKNADLAADLAPLYRPLGYRLFVDTIVELSDDTIRAPDIAVVDRDTAGRKHLLPADILLAIEISDTTLSEDAGPKRIAYASAGIRRYWVVDIQAGRIHCYGKPEGVDYTEIAAVAFGDPLPVPGTDAAITIA